VWRLYIANEATELIVGTSQLLDGYSKLVSAKIMEKYICLKPQDVKQSGNLAFAMS
jgi:hypothetical protein